MSARVRIARLYQSRGETAKALAELEDMIGLVPKDTWARRVLAQIYTSLGRNRDAISQYRKILELDPGNGGAVAALKSLKKVKYEP